MYVSSGTNGSPKNDLGCTVYASLSPTCFQALVDLVGLVTGVLEELVHPLHLLGRGTPVARHPVRPAHVGQSLLVVVLGVEKSPIDGSFQSSLLDLQ